MNRAQKLMTLIERKRIEYPKYPDLGSEEANALRSKLSSLQLKALKAFPSSPRQKLIQKEIDDIYSQLKSMGIDTTKLF
jgi:hypothetical protein